MRRNESCFSVRPFRGDREGVKKRPIRGECSTGLFTVQISASTTLGRWRVGETERQRKAGGEKGRRGESKGERKGEIVRGRGIEFEGW